jgi:hypothetical protein
MPAYSGRSYTRHPSQIALSDEELIRRYLAGEGIYTLEIATGMTSRAVRDILTAHGVEIRKRGGVKGSTYQAHKFLSRRVQRT